MASVARVLVDQLLACGADRAFGVPGESYLAVLDALVDSPSLPFVSCRHEGGAAFAAEAHGKLTGRPGVLLVSRGPGVFNAATGIHTAQQDETPMVVLVGQLPMRLRGRDAFQEVDLGRVFGSVCSWVHELVDPSRIAEVISTAWTIACAGRPGPVMIGLPEDVLDLEIDAAIVAPAPPARTAVDERSAREVRDMLARSERPVVIVGGSRWTADAIDALPRTFPGIPLVTGFRRQDLVDHRLDCFAGALGLGSDPGLIRSIQSSDLVIAIGDRLDDPTTDGFTLLDRPDAVTPLVHVHADARELGRTSRPTVSIAADPGAFLDAVGPVTQRPAWTVWTTAARAGYVSWQQTDGPLDEVVRGLRELLPDDAIVTNGAGNFTRPLHRAFRYHRPGRQLAPTGGSMGYGLPAALAAKLAHPERVVVCVAGDGDLMMSVHELATIAHHRSAIVVLVVDNACYGTIRTHQQRRYPDRPIGTTLTSPDFADLARSFGMQARRATSAPDACSLRCSRRSRPTWHRSCISSSTDTSRPRHAASWARGAATTIRCRRSRNAGFSWRSW